MSRQTIKTGTRLVTLALAAGAALSLAACEEHAYPSAAPQEGTAAPSAGDATLAGAPNAPPPPYGPSPYARPGYGPQGYTPPGGYPPGVIVQPPANGAPEIITMAPIPNPPEGPMRHGWRHRRHYRYAAGAPAYVFHPYFCHRRHHLNRGASAWVFHPASRHAVSPPPAHAAPSAPAHTAVGPAQLAKPQAPAHGRRRHKAVDATTAAAAGGGPVAGGVANSMSSNSTGGSEADHYGALQQGLQGLFANEARLEVPGQMDANQAATVTLTLPADFAQAAQSEAAKDGAPQAATSMNVIAALTGDGYTITPVDAQSLPLTLNTPTVFQWRVTPTGGARNPLKVSAKAQGAGDSHTLDLGSKTSRSDAGTGRLIGLGLLVIIIFGGIIAWFTRSPRRKGPIASKPRATHTNGTPT